jgi:hypothetical protein
MRPGETTGTRRLPTARELELSRLQRDLARRHDLSPVMVDTLARLKAHAHVYPSRVKPLVRRGFVTDDGRRLTEAGASLADGLDVEPA